jgi:hypothetical protein
LRRLHSELHSPNAEEVLKEVWHEASEEKQRESKAKAEYPLDEFPSLG